MEFRACDISRLLICETGKVENFWKRCQQGLIKKPEFMLEQASIVSKKCHVIKDRKKSENAKLVCLNCGDNEKLNVCPHTLKIITREALIG